MTVPDGTARDSRSRQTEELRSLLTEIWRDALGAASIGLDDHFFDLGGNSITNVIIGGRARDLGVPMTTRLLFDNPTIRMLSTALLEANPGLSVGAWAAGSTVPLSPFQRGFLERRSGPHMIELRAVRRLEPDLLQAALAAVSERHESLRLRVVRGPAGWIQTVAEPDGSSTFAHHDLRGSAARASGGSVRRLRESLAESLDITSGPTLVAALLDTDEAGHLLVAAHPLVADRHALELLIDEISLAYEQLEDGVGLTLPQPAAPFSRWSTHLNDWLGSDEAGRELSHWLGLPRADGEPWGTSPSSSADPQPEAHLTARADLSEERTSALLDTLAGQPLIDVLDVLLAGVAGAAGTWTGGSRALVDLECDGRRGSAADHDFSATAGACTTLFPFVADLSGADSPAEQVWAVRAARRAVPQGGAGYGALRWLSLDPAVREQLAAEPAAEICVRFRSTPPSLFDEVTTEESPDRHVLTVTGRIDSGHLRVSVSGRCDSAAGELVGELADAIVARIGQAVDELERGAAHTYTPDDFPLSGLGPEQLTKLLSGLTTDEDTTQR